MKKTRLTLHNIRHKQKYLNISVEDIRNDILNKLNERVNSLLSSESKVKYTHKGFRISTRLRLRIKNKLNKSRSVSWKVL